MKILPVLFFVMTLQQQACKKQTIYNNPVTPGATALQLASDKAVYHPGETVRLSISNKAERAFVRYRHLNELLRDEPLAGGNWTWQPPANDYRGYLVEVYQKEEGKEKVLASIAVDVSSDWNRFPRYGFLSKFDNVPDSRMDSVMAALTRYHINGIQFYDWHFDHHRPLAGTPAAPADQWKDIANRDIYKSTVQGYIRRSHDRGMKAMFYNLCYGALSNAAADGVLPEWYMYKDAAHNNRDAFVLPKPPFRSDIFFTDPSNTSWQQYLAGRTAEVYSVYEFDGFHVDQVGDRGTVYRYNGMQLDLAATFQPFLQSMKNAHANKRLLMNAVNQFGQQNSIAVAPVDFLYSELWDGNEGYKELAAAIRNNNAWSSGKSSVLAAYINYRKAENPGYFNTPGVLLANAVIFAFGGSHLEMGEHMLAKEYFPNSNLQMTDELKSSIVGYYDFLTAYQNLLRDGGTFVENLQVSCSNGKMAINNWPPQSGSVAVQSKNVGKRQVSHFINFINTSSLEWRDTNGTQPAPRIINDAEIQISFGGIATKVWVASPDLAYGSAQSLSFTQSGNTVKFILPDLKYWNMVVIE